jgi:hypothetical protein
MLKSSTSERFEYVLGDLKWECEYSVEIQQSKKGNRRKTLVIHLPNDGYFYINGVQMEEFLRGKVKQADIPNSRHKKNCPEGWSVLDKNVWKKVAPFEEFMVYWFGDENCQPEHMKRSIMYYADANRVDICLRHKDRHVGVEFSFEHCCSRWMMTGGIHCSASNKRDHGDDAFLLKMVVLLL